ncbi:DUF3540 domain-containing protein [Aliikangiella coralliicola]|uniref:DUF3540 domain-containing protein n=1 Tax=Aliikangiella coralliicola TaxID=2592383 RepID=A0A545UDA8_9GAMM|nr:DUF3540 domain-containing protein [Aliikangiella coralliicola]TQV87448.1 DUF3540 domain-containing protein [Aliikangiella coralliicola]
MKMSNQPISLEKAPTQAKMFIGEITEMLEQGRYRINACYLAQKSFGCLIEPQVSDQVLIIQQADKMYISQIISREGGNQATLSLPQAEKVTLHAQQLNLSSIEKTQIQTQGDLELLSCGGKILTNATQIVFNAIETLVQLARNSIHRATNIDQQAEVLIRNHSQYQLVTASKDIKIDAERINMG